MTDLNEQVDISYDACIELNDKARQVLMTLLIDEPLRDCADGVKAPLTRDDFECDVQMFQQFVTVAGERFNKLDSDYGKLFSTISRLSERLSPSGVASIDAGEAYAIERISDAFIRSADAQEANLHIQQYQSILEPF